MVISVALATSILTAPETPIHWLLDGIHESINEPGHSFAFVPVHPKFIKDIVLSSSNVSDITQGWHSKLIV